MDFIRDEQGATAIEYGLIAALVSVALVTSLMMMRQGIARSFTTVAAALEVAEPNTSSTSPSTGFSPNPGYQVTQAW